MKKTILFVACAFAVLSGNAQIITTIAGNGMPGTRSANGVPATAATVYGYMDLDQRGNIYIGNGYERKIDRKGIITDFAGGSSLSGLGDGGPATSATLSAPDGSVADANGNIYICDVGDTRVRVVDKSGLIHTYAGGGATYPYDGGPATAADMRGGVLDVAMDAAGNLYIAGNTIKKVDATGVITTIGGIGSPGWYSGDNIPATGASFDAAALVLDGTGNMYFTDMQNNMIRKINTAGIISTLAGDGSPVRGFGGDGGPSTAAKLNGPGGLALDATGNIYFVDELNHRIRRIDAVTGVITTVAGNGTAAFSGDGGLFAAAKFNTPDDIYIDCGGNMYIDDGYNYRVRKVTYTAYMDFVSEGNAITVCENGGPVNVDTMLRVSDTAHGQPVDWMVHTSAMHGTVSGGYSATSAGVSLTPTGFSYTPAPGYSGADSFTILVGPCAQVGDLRTIHVTVTPLPIIAAISGAASICHGSVVSLSEPTTGGVWSVSGAAVSVSGGKVTGLAPGTATVSYTVTDGNGCVNWATYAMKVGTARRA